MFFSFLSLLALALPFGFGWLFLKKQIAQDNEIKNKFVEILFILTFGVSFCFFILMIFETLDVLGRGFLFLLPTSPTSSHSSFGWLKDSLVSLEVKSYVHALQPHLHHSLLPVLLFRKNFL